MLRQDAALKEDHRGIAAVEFAITAPIALVWSRRVMTLP